MRRRLLTATGTLLRSAASIRPSDSTTWKFVVAEQIGMETTPYVRNIY